jgi:hypothetical protein
MYSAEGMGKKGQKVCGTKGFEEPVLNFSSGARS